MFIRKSRRPALAIATLEDRTVPTTVSFESGTLYVTGTSSAETISIKQFGGQIQVSGVYGAHSADEIDQIVVDALDGSDTVDLVAPSGYEPITNLVWIYGGSGNDTLKGAEGNDLIFGGTGADKIYGNGGEDLLDGGSGNDTIEGGSANDDVYGDLGNDKVFGDAGDDFVSGGSGTDSVYGGAGQDTLDGGAGTDYLSGGTEYDRYFDDSGTSYGESSTGNSRTAGHTAWFDQKMTDQNLRSAARVAWYDGYGHSNFSRDDMLWVFDAAKEDGKVTLAEINDFKAMGSEGSKFNMPEYVQKLTKKVVGYNTANATYQGAFLGNLAANDSATKFDRLIGKWFKGSDHPIARAKNSVGQMVTLNYESATGSLFGSDSVPFYTDVKQGAVGDCYFVAALGEAALMKPATIQNMFIDNGDETWTVRLYVNGVADYVTVDRAFPVTSTHKFAFANRGDQVGDATAKLWVALAEKAYAQRNEEGGLGQETNKNSYESIDGGQCFLSMRQITGLNAAFMTNMDSTTIRSEFNAGHLVALTSRVSGTAANVVPIHQYMLIGYDSATQKYRLANPWGPNGGIHNGVQMPGELNLTWSQVLASFDSWDHTNS